MEHVDCEAALHLAQKRCGSVFDRTCCSDTLNIHSTRADVRGSSHVVACAAVGSDRTFYVATPSSYPLWPSSDLQRVHGLPMRGAPSKLVRE